MKAEPAHARQAFDGQRFGESGNAFDDGVAAADQNQQQLIEHLLLADDDFRELAANVCGKSGKMLQDQWFSRGARLLVEARVL